MLKSNMLLNYCNSELPILIRADASNYGVEAVVHIFSFGSQKAMSHASCSMTLAERNYGQIQKESLTIV